MDFQHRFAIVAVADEEGAERIVGVGRFDLRDEVSAEFALVVRDDYQGLGLGTALLARLLDLARARGVRLMTGDVRAENRRMLRLLTSQGFRIGKLDHGAVPVSAPIDDPLSVLSVFGILARRRQLRRGCSSPPSGPRGCALTRPGRWTWRRS